MNINELPIGTVILEPQKFLNEAIVKFDDVLYYDYYKLIDCFCALFEQEETNKNECFSMAKEWIDFNIVGNPNLLSEIELVNY